MLSRLIAVRTSEVCSSEYSSACITAGTPAADFLGGLTFGFSTPVSSVAVMHRGLSCSCGTAECWLAPEFFGSQRGAALHGRAFTWRRQRHFCYRPIDDGYQCPRARRPGCRAAIASAQACGTRAAPVGRATVSTTPLLEHCRQPSGRDRTQPRVMDISGYP